MILNLNNVTKKYSQAKTSVTAVQNIDLQLEAGKFTVLLGPSGCGKSTLLRMIAGLEKPSEGSIIFDGSLITKPDQRRGMVFQQFALFPWLTVKENIAFGLKLNKKTPDIAATVNRYLKLTGLEAFQNHYPNTLSGGMQQRVAIARTLANKPEIILLDEPFGSLDVQTRSQMQEFLSNLYQEEQVTMIMVTHDIEEAIYLGDRVIVMETKPGRIKEAVDINFARPRNTDIKFSEEFTDIKKHLSYLVHSEAIKAAWNSAPDFDKEKVKIAVNVWPGTSPLYLAQDLDFFGQQDLTVELVNVEKHEERYLKWMNNEIDLLDTTLDTAVLLKQQVPNLQIAFMKDVSHGGDALITGQSINSVQELKGKTIAVEKGWVSHFFLLYLLQLHGLSSKDVIIKNMRGSDIGSAVIAGQVDAGVIWEPWLSKILELSNAKVLADTTTMPILYDCIVFKEHYANAHPEIAGKIKAAWLQSLDYLRDFFPIAGKIISSYISIPQRELEAQLSRLHFIRQMDKAELSRKIEEIQTVLVNEGLTDKIHPQEFLKFYR